MSNVIRKICSLPVLLALVLAIPMFPAASVQAASTHDVTLYGANGGDATDDRASIQSAINAASAGDTVYFPAGTYYISNKLMGKSGVRLQGEARNTTIIKAATGSGSQFAGLKVEATMLNLNNISNMDISELTFDANSNNAVTSAIWGEPGIGHKIHRIKVKDITQSTGFGPFGILFSGTPDVEITDSEFTNIGTQSMWGGAIRVGWGSHNAKILNNTIHNMGRGGIFVNDGSTGAVIKHNVISGSSDFISGYGFGIEVHTDCNYTIIEDNVMDHWLSVVRSQYTSIRRNYVGTSNGTYKSYGLEVSAAPTIVTDNVVDGGQHNGISMSPGNGQHIFAYNTIQNMIQWGMQLHGDGTPAPNQYLYFYKNVWKNTDKDNPIAVYPGTAGNAIRINGKTTDTTFDSNQIINNDRLGIQITGAAGVDRLSFVNNTITGNGGLSVDPYPAAALDLEWSGNTVSGNGSNVQLTSRGFSNAKPTASFTASRLIVPLGQAVTFTNTSTDPGGSIVHNLWDFGEGVPNTTASPTYTYEKAGTYKVKLLVTDNGGRMHLSEQTIVVDAGPADTQAPTAPSGLALLAKTDTTARLSWNPSTDNVGVAGYNIYKNGVLDGATGGAGATEYLAAGLTPNTAYSFTVKAKDGTGNLSAASNALNVTTNAPDTEPPSVPANLSLSYKTDTTAKLTWAASTDNVGVTGYDVFRNGTLAGSTLGAGATEFMATGLTAGSTYSFTVKAKDVKNNLSAASNGLSVTTYGAQEIKYASDLSWVSATAGFGAVRQDKSSSGNALRLDGVTYSKGIGTHANSDIVYQLNGNYGRFVSDVGVDDQVTHANASIVFQVWADGALLFDSGVMNALSATKTVDVPVAGVNQIKLTVTDSGNGNSYDHGDWAAARFTPSGSGNPNPADTQPPTAPANLTAPSKTSVSVSLSWTASTDNVGVTGYNVYKGGVLEGSTAGTTYTATGLSANTAYSFTVKAKDAANNESAASNTLNVTTDAPPADTQPPTAPANLTAPSKTSVSVSLSWTASTDNVGVTGYNIYKGGVLEGSTAGTTYTATGLSANTAYSFTVKAKDAANNESAASNTLNVTTDAAGNPGGGTGTIVREYWTGVGGETIADIPLGTPPTGTSILTSLEGPSNFGNSYATRIRGYITPAVSGDYTFYIASDNAGELWLSPDSNPANKSRIAYVSTWSGYRDWTGNATQKSVTLSLTAGQAYYVEVLHKEKSSSDHLSVGWTGPGISAITVIDGSYLSPY